VRLSPKPLIDLRACQLDQRVHTHARNPNAHRERGAGRARFPPSARSAVSPRARVFGQGPTSG
jgi:hypothetical protein